MLYKIVATNKATINYRKLPFLEDRIIPDWPPLALHGFFCVHGVEVKMPNKGKDVAIYASECEMLHDDAQEKGFVSGDHKFNKLSDEFWKDFWLKPPSITIKVCYLCVSLKSLLVFIYNLCLHLSVCDDFIIYVMNILLFPGC